MTETEIHFGHDSPASALSPSLARSLAISRWSDQRASGHRSSIGHSFVMRCVLGEREGEREGEGAVRISISNYVLLCLREKDWDAREGGQRLRRARGEGERGTKVN